MRSYLASFISNSFLFLAPILTAQSLQPSLMREIQHVIRCVRPFQKTFEQKNVLKILNVFWNFCPLRRSVSLGDKIRPEQYSHLFKQGSPNFSDLEKPCDLSQTLVHSGKEATDPEDHVTTASVSDHFPLLNADFRVPQSPKACGVGCSVTERVEQEQLEDLQGLINVMRRRLYDDTGAIGLAWERLQALRDLVEVLNKELSHKPSPEILHQWRLEFYSELRNLLFTRDAGDHFLSTGRKVRAALIKEQISWSYCSQIYCYKKSFFEEEGAYAQHKLVLLCDKVLIEAEGVRRLATKGSLSLEERSHRSHAIQRMRRLLRELQGFVEAVDVLAEHFNQACASTYTQMSYWENYLKVFSQRHCSLPPRCWLCEGLQQTLTDHCRISASMSQPIDVSSYREIFIRIRRKCELARWHALCEESI